MYQGDPQTPKLKQLLRSRQPLPRRGHRADKWRWKEPSENEKCYFRTKVQLGQSQPVFWTLRTCEVRPRRTVWTKNLLQPVESFWRLELV